MQSQADERFKKTAKKKTPRKQPVLGRGKLHHPENVSGSSSSSSSASSSVQGASRSKVNKWTSRNERKSDGQVSTAPATSPQPPSRTISCPQLEVIVQCHNNPDRPLVLAHLQPNAPKIVQPKQDCVDYGGGEFAIVSVSHAKKTHVRSRSDVPQGSNFPVVALVVPRSAQKEKCSRRRSLLEEGGSAVVPTTECFFPQPEKGQSLTSFLSSEDFQTCAELDRENAHFYISEALISAMEQIRCKQVAKRVEECEDDSDEEIRHLKQRIRIRRCERQQEKVRQKCFALLSDGKTDTATTSQSASSPLSSSSTDVSGESSMETDDDDVDQLELSDTNESTLSSMNQSGLSLSMASLYSDADIKRVGTGPAQDEKCSSQEESMSAEGVALCLLKKFSEKQLPKASDLEWLVSEQDAPQRLLPLPDSWPISPDDAEDALCLKKTRLRGTADWAPPRAQIIFDIHPEPNRKLIVARQKYRCAGCGMRTDRGYVGRFRYCEYLGKYFCQCCHSNKTSVVPGRILRRWDFYKYPVCNFSHDLLDRMHTDPLFNVMDVNSGLYHKSSRLESTRNLRLQMFYLKDFVGTCKMTRRLRQQVAGQPRHWFHEPHLYSIYDFEQVKQGHMSDQLRYLASACIEHVFRCPICTAKGFICETCRNPRDIIFPFQLRKVIQCHGTVGDARFQRSFSFTSSGCGACFHRECFVSGKCPKCTRIQERRRRIAETIYSSDEEEDT